ncbi:MAG: sigma-54-dependent Fis family transcriptional regulator [Sphingomonadales bacterium]|nr:sigma-54-dependent Fis family transcriptional regulator [Sphingomonadales bacterium]
MTGTNPPVMLIEDDDALREATAQALALEGFSVEEFAEAGSALRRFDEDFAGVVVTDVRLPGMDGIELFERLRERDSEVQAIFTTGHGDVAMAVEAMKSGAADFFTKPYPSGALIEAVRRAAEKRALVIENRRLREALRHNATTYLLGSSDQVHRLDRLVSEVARTDIDIRIIGENGVGKSFLAKRIHDLSGRHDRPFVAIDIGVWSNGDAELLLFGRDRVEGLSRSGLIERAQGGTLLLDDADAVPPGLQGRFRALLENRTFQALGAERPRAIDIRIIAVTRSGLGEREPTEEGGQSLVDRLGGVAISVPALRERREDVAIIFRYFVSQFENQLGVQAAPLSKEDWTYLQSHGWPGNLRELRDFARTFVLGLTRLTQPITGSGMESPSLRELVLAFEKNILEDALRKTDGQIAAVQRMLSLKRKTLYDKLARHDLKPQDFRN